MKRSRIIMDFLRLGDGAIAQKASVIKTSMTGNAYFPNPMPSPDELEAVIVAYNAALIGAATFDRVKISIKNTMRGNLESILVRLSNYITAIADGDRTMLLSTGFTISKEISPAVVLGHIQNFTIERGTVSGQVILSLDKVDNALSYTFFYAIAGEEHMVWESEQSSTTSVAVSDLQLGKNYSFYVSALGSKGKTLDCEVVTKMVS